MSVLHRCGADDSAHSLTYDFMEARGMDGRGAWATLGDMLALFEAHRQGQDEETRKAAEKACENYRIVEEAKSVTICETLAHSMSFVLDVPLKVLCMAVVSDTWDFASAVFNAERIVRAWKSDDKHPHLHHTIGMCNEIANLMVFSADDRPEDDTVYWQNRLLFAIDFRREFLEDVLDDLDAVNDQIREDTKKQQAEQFRQMLSGAAAVACGHESVSEAQQDQQPETDAKQPKIPPIGGGTVH